MKPSAFRRGMAAAIASLLVPVGAAVSVAPAFADDKDADFLQYLDWKNVPYANPTEVIRAAKQYCLDRTRPGQKYLANWETGQKMGWTDSEVKEFVNAAIPAYCPGAW